MIKDVWRLIMTDLIDGWRLKFSVFDGCRLLFLPFDDWRLNPLRPSHIDRRLLCAYNFLHGVKWKDFDTLSSNCYGDSFISRLHIFIYYIYILNMFIYFYYLNTPLSLFLHKSSSFQNWEVICPFLQLDDIFIRLRSSWLICLTGQL